MVNSEEYSTELRLLQPEVIWLEPEHFEQATEISNQVNGEAQEWQTYLNALALFGFEQWLRERIPDKPVNREPNLIESICHLKVGEFRYGLVATEQVLDEAVNVPQAAIERPELTAHFYVLLEVDEEQEQIVVRGFLRYDELINYRSTVNLKLSQDSCYQLPLSLFDTEPNHLLFYSRYLDPTAIPLPVTSPDSIQDSLKETFQSTITQLSQWLQGTLDEGWLSWEALVTPEANLAWSTRNASEGTKKGKLINLGMQLESQTVALLITVTSETSEKVGILVQLYPTGEERYLPANLQLTLRSRAGKILQSTQSRSQDNYIQLKPFKGKPGTRFSVEVSMGDVIVREDFEL
ncbi:DUF1822 family protein [Pleurocapsa sp. PCC 7319]|uniref:DUF1822 family protein n=1 Tax=Pleurocapsa sp. PCC 7319 TaxID=118161 RepID=UPI00034A96BB|nr:DUF1822 family protein [Pleurocapsa sp. PCC 7319]